MVDEENNSSAGDAKFPASGLLVEDVEPEVAVAVPTRWSDVVGANSNENIAKSQNAFFFFVFGPPCAGFDAVLN
jgi:hypothetical protein